MISTNRIIIGIALLIIIFGCDSEDSKPHFYADPIVHIVGAKYDGSSMRASYWKDDVHSYVQPAGKQGLATDVTMYNNNVFVAVVDNSSEERLYSVWEKLNKQTVIGEDIDVDWALSSGEMTVSPAGDVYTLRAHSNETMYMFKSGQFAWAVNGIPFDMKANNQDVYVVGTQIMINPANTYVANLWKNDQIQYIVDMNSLTAGQGAAATGIQLTDQSIYVSGYIGRNSLEKSDEAFLWKDGIRTTLPSGNGSARANGLFVCENDVYVGGWSATSVGGVKHASYWKNGKLVVLDKSDAESEVLKVAVSKSGKVYAIGWLGPDKKAALWENGKLSQTMNGKQSVHEVVSAISLEEK